MKIASVQNLDMYKTGERVIIPGRYFNSNGHAIAIVAVVTVGVDWAAYIGEADPHRELEAYPHVAETGSKLQWEDAKHFFPSLRPGWYRP